MKYAIVQLAAVVLAAAGAVAQDEPAGAWTPVSITNNAGFFYGGSATDGTYLYLCGSNAPGTPSQTRRWDPLTDSWEILADMPGSVGGNAAVYYGGAIYSFGNGIVSSTDIHRYDVAGATWSTLSTVLPVTLRYASAAVIGTKIYVTG